MGIKYTPEQQKVIELHNRNILVSAAAGSGKTAVLVERIIRMICNETDPVDIDHLLIVTFTKAAAAEMRERISQGITRQLLLNPHSEHIQRQSTLLHNAQITTIDSFCMFLVKNHFNEIGLDPAFRTADEGEAHLMKQDVMDSLLEEGFREKSEDFQFCVEYFCPNGREKTLEDYIFNLHQYAESFPWPEEWLLKRKADYALSDTFILEETDFGRYLLRYVRNMIRGCGDTMKQVQRLCQEPDGPYMYGELADQELQQIENLLKYESLDALSAHLPVIIFGRLPSKKDDSVSTIKRELAKGLRQQTKDTLKELTERFFTTPLPLAFCQMSQCQRPVETLIDLTVTFGRRFREKKQDKKLMDFSDMEHYALDILVHKEEGKICPSNVAKEYRQYFHEILIDEYQDSNLVQEYLLRAMSGEEGEESYNRFMVGDVKQSIYKFRLARPELFLEKYHTYTREDSLRQCIDLSKNFRSRREVVDSVNGIFQKIMNEDMGGIAYDDNAALYASAEYPENEDCISELLLYEKPDRDNQWNAKQVEALAIAARIKELRQHFKVTDRNTGKLRETTFRDIVILLRTNMGWDETFKKVLEEEGIPVYVTTKTGYFAASEVQELLQFLKVLSNPRQDIPLFGTMRSPFGQFSEEEIAILKSNKHKTSLYKALQTYSKEKDETDPLSQKTADFLRKIDKYRKMTVYLPIRELLLHIVRDHDYLHYTAALPSGSKRKANVEMLFTKASDFEKTSYFGLFHFIRYIEQLEKYDVDYGEAELIDENADVVRIMSIHKSKGLEFPVTFVAGLSKRFNMQDTNKAVIVDMDLGIGVDYVNPEKRIRNKTLRRTALSCKLREDNLAEELRVLYVALTRAKEKLILTATLDQAQQKWEMEQEMGERNLTWHDFMEAGSYMDFILPVIGHAGFKIVIGRPEELKATGLREQIQLMERKEKLTQAESLADLDDLEALRQRFAWQYPFKAMETLYTKTTVSELKIAAMAEKDEAAFHAFEEQEVVPYIPAFRREKQEVSGAQRGDAYHRTMELLDFSLLYQNIFTKKPDNAEAFINNLQENILWKNLNDIIERETREGRLREEYREILNLKKFMNFAKSPIAFRMWLAQESGKLHREQPFVYGISADRLSKDFPPEEKVMIQGIIDVFFEEEGELVIVDYKTDVIGSPRELWDRYEVQMQYYEEALSKITGIPIKEKVLYSFYLEQCVV